MLGTFCYSFFENFRPGEKQALPFTDYGEDKTNCNIGKCKHEDPKLFFLQQGTFCVLLGYLQLELAKWLGGSLTIFAYQLLTHELERSLKNDVVVRLFGQFVIGACHQSELLALGRCLRVPHFTHPVIYNLIFFTEN